MDERVVQFRVGAMVLATLLITLILVFLFGEGPEMFKGRLTIHMIFTEAPMVMENTPVKKSGVLIGRVTKVGRRPLDHTCEPRRRIGSAALDPV